MSFEVKGHWRNQWDPVLRIWRKRWVETYEKGDGMPTRARPAVATVDEAEGYLRQNAIGDHMLMFTRALVEADAFAGDMENENFLYFLEKPWKWSRQFLAWDQAMRPMDDSEPGWDQFYEACDVAWPPKPENE